jgi:hypothetical protein
MNEQIMQGVPMWVLAGLAAGWLAETFLSGRGYGLLADLGLGVGAGLVGGGAFLMLSGVPVGMVGMFVSGFVVATGAIVAQRLWLSATADAVEARARMRLVELHGRAGPFGVDRSGRPMPATVLVRIARSGIYLLRGVPLELQRAARARAASDRTTLRQVLLQGLSEYAAGTWTPRSGAKPPAAAGPSARAAG